MAFAKITVEVVPVKLEPPSRFMEQALVNIVKPDVAKLRDQAVMSIDGRRFTKASIGIAQLEREVIRPGLVLPNKIEVQSGVASETQIWEAYQIAISALAANIVAAIKNPTGRYRESIATYVNGKRQPLVKSKIGPSTNVIISSDVPYASPLEALKDGSLMMAAAYRAKRATDPQLVTVGFRYGKPGNAARVGAGAMPQQSRSGNPTAVPMIVIEGGGRGYSGITQAGRNRRRRERRR